MPIPRMVRNISDLPGEGTAEGRRVSVTGLEGFAHFKVDGSEMEKGTRL